MIDIYLFIYPSNIFIACMQIMRDKSVQPSMLFTRQYKLHTSLVGFEKYGGGARRIGHAQRRLTGLKGPGLNLFLLIYHDFELK